MIHRYLAPGAACALLALTLGCGGGSSENAVAEVPVRAPADRLRTLLAQAPDTGFTLVLTAGDTLRLSPQTVRFYNRHRFRPIWSEAGNVERARQAHAVLGQAPTDGLDPMRYGHGVATQLLAQLEQEDEDGDPVLDDVARSQYLADLDLVLSEGYMRYATDLVRGTTDPEVAGRGWRIPRSEPPTEAVLRSAARGDVAQIVDKLRPTAAQYRRLMEGLQRLRQIEQAGGWQMVDAAGALEVGDSSAVVAALRTRLAASDDSREAALAQRGSARAGVYDRDLRDALRHFQTRHGLEDDGALGENTLRELNHTVAERVAELELNLDRWRWLPGELGELYIMVNIAGFELEVIENGRPIEAMNVVVGQPGWTTPVFADTMQYLVVNPYWNPPESILQAEIYPAMARDPGYLERNNFERTSEGRIRQKPGPGNALGDYKFLFPNKDNIYLHDTPSDHLFSRTRRDFSHGCVRLERPADLARLVLAKSTNHSPTSLEGMRATGREKWVTLKRPIPIYIVYFTTWVKEDGTLRFHHDVYGHDEELREGTAPERVAGM